MHYSYKIKGVCASEVQFDVEDGVLRNIEFSGGCDGNLKGLGALAEGMSPSDAMERLKGIGCGSKKTSCPDQLSLAIQELAL